MRLIDADWAERKAKEIIDGYAWAIRMAVGNAPTVDAVPLDKLCEWLAIEWDCPPEHHKGDELCISVEYGCKDCWRCALTKWMEGLDGNK